MTRRLVSLVAAVASLAGCASLDGHRCAGAADSCGPGGRCEPDGLCSFADGACPSGRAYGDEVAGGVAGQCTANACGDRTLLWRDEFDQPGPGPRFTSDPANTGANDEVDGQLAISVGVSAGDGGEYHSAATLDLRGGAVIVEVASLPPNERFFTIFEVTLAGAEAQIWHTMTSMPRLVVDINDTDLEQRPWDGLERFWRLSERDGTMRWDVSADGVTWQLMHSEAPPFDLSQVTGTLRAWSEGQGGTVRFESFTVCGP
ncbi:MAG: hypothetical protein IPH80_19315 [Myxococcales bacterium]|nr:hypothetical protein [Myxococcales bacterium]MBP6842263.1 hypothetical protein [Kofleriaceae bacterium]